MKKMVIMLVVLAGFAVQNGAADGGGFADFRKQQQARLLAAIDNSLAAEAENAINNFAAVKQAEVQLQTGLGGRKANLGVNLIGAFDESESHAFGWQVRAYGGEEETKGANLGVFYRHIGENALLGVNAFADYHNGNYGDFVRYSIGGEAKNAFVGFDANYYAPLTDEQKVNSTVAAFSRAGYDAKLRIQLPKADYLKVALDYYHFDGKRDTKAVKGFRYGVEVHPLEGLRAGWYYDKNSGKGGGDISYSYAFGKVQTRQIADNFTPDLFAAVTREYSQRIATVAIAPGDSLHITPPVTTIMTMITPQGTTTITATMPPVTIIMTATMPPVTTIMTMETERVAATRMASVQATLGAAGNGGIPASTYQRFLVTLPPASHPRPYTVAIAGNFFNAANNPDFRVIANQSDGNFSSDYIRYTITVVEGSEQFISITTMLTTRTTTAIAPLTTRMTTTMAAVTTRTTTAIAPLTTRTTTTMAAVTTRIPAGASIDIATLTIPQMDTIVIAAVTAAVTNTIPAITITAASGVTVVELTTGISDSRILQISTTIAITHRNPYNAASVHFTVRYDFSRNIGGQPRSHWILATSRIKYLVTLPQVLPGVPVRFPQVITVQGSFDRPGNEFFVLQNGGPVNPYNANAAWDYGAPIDHPEFMTHTLTIAEGSEERFEFVTVRVRNTQFIFPTRFTTSFGVLASGVATTITTRAIMLTTMLTTSFTNTVTIAPMLTTFVTNIISANLAIMDDTQMGAALFVLLTTAPTFLMPPLDSRFRGNNEKNTPPNFPHKRAAFSSIAPRTFYPTG